jgi:hypothetical protein
MRLAAFLAALGLAFAAHAAPSAPAGVQKESAVESPTLRSIAGWLRAHGASGYLGADVADAMGIGRDAGGESLPARQRGFRNDQVLRIAQIPAEEGRDFLLFMVQHPDDQVFFYFSTVREGLKKAFVSIPSRNVVAPLERHEAERNFRSELLYWEDKAATR